VPLNLHPARPEPPDPMQGLRVATWNSTGSDDPQKLEEIAKLVWGAPDRRYLRDLVLIQEFSRDQQSADINELLNTLVDNGWRFFRTADEGPGASSRRAYLVVWNPESLAFASRPRFVDYTQQAPSPPPHPGGKWPRQRRRPSRFNTEWTENSQPLAMDCDRRRDQLTLFAYTWHVTPTSAAARVGEWPSDELSQVNAVAGTTAASQIVHEMQQARNKQALWLLAGDLNVQQQELTAYGFEGVRPIFPRSLGFRIVSSKLDHIIALYGDEVRLAADYPRSGMPILGDHQPLAAVLYTR